MTATIGSVAQLVSVIQRHLAAHLPATNAGKKNVAAAAPSPADDRYAQQNLAALVELRVRQISRDDPQRGRKAFRAFLEAVLLSHFGAELVNDPRFFQMVDDIQLTLEADAQCGELVASAIQQLLSEK